MIVSLDQHPLMILGFADAEIREWDLPNTGRWSSACEFSWVFLQLAISPVVCICSRHGTKDVSMKTPVLE